jgi:hypothetical protein
MMSGESIGESFDDDDDVVRLGYGRLDRLDPRKEVPRR